MKRSNRFRSHALRLLLSSACLCVTSGCLSLPQFSTVAPEPLGGTPAGPPEWDETAETAFDIDLPEVAATEKRSSSPANSPSDAVDSDGKENDRLRLAQRENGQRNGRLGRVAGRGPIPKLVEAPPAFQWKAAGTSAGSREIKTIVIGRGGYRTLLVGSLAGNDPVAIHLTERLAKHVHENQIVLGGIQLTVVRNLNPDGEVNKASENEDGVYLNRQISRSANQTTDPSQFPAEIQFLFRQLEDGQPQRVIHLRTVGRDQGIVAHSSGAKDVAEEIAEWVNFQQLELPGRSAEGTLERYLSETEQCEIVTFAFPKSVSMEDAWDLYSDALLNLLMDEDFATRKLAREQKASKAADRRGRND